MDVEAPPFNEYLIVSQFLVCLASAVPSSKMKPHWKQKRREWREKVEQKKTQIHL
jgi:hypothetical protein